MAALEALVPEGCAVLLAAGPLIERVACARVQAFYPSLCTRWLASNDSALVLPPAAALSVRLKIEPKALYFFAFGFAASLACNL